VQKVANFIPDGRYKRTSNRTSRSDNYFKNCIRIRIYSGTIAGTGSQPDQVLDPFLNNQGAHGHSLGVLDSDIKKRRTDKKAPGEPPKIRTEIQM
jgi:hypothetical protein